MAFLILHRFFGTRTSGLKDILDISDLDFYCPHTHGGTQLFFKSVEGQPHTSVRVHESIEQVDRAVLDAIERDHRTELAIEPDKMTMPRMSLLTIEATEALNRRTAQSYFAHAVNPGSEGLELAALTRMQAEAAVDRSTNGPADTAQPLCRF